MKLEVGKKYRTVDGTIVTVKAYEGDPVYPFRVAYNSDSLLYTEDGFYYRGKTHHELNIIEEVKENTMFNKEYKYLCMDADGYNKLSIKKPTLLLDHLCWDDYDLLLQKNVFNLGDDWKESLREIVYNDDGSIYLRKPRHEFKVDDKVLVRNVGCDWVRSHFFCYRDDGGVVCYVDGKTSFTTSNASCWDEIKPYEED